MKSIFEPYKTLKESLDKLQAAVLKSNDPEAMLEYAKLLSTMESIGILVQK